MLDAIAAKFPGGCEIFLANIYDPTDGAGTAHVVLLPSWPDGERVLAEYNAVISRVAARHRNVHLVDLHALFMGHGITCAQFWRSSYRADDPHCWFSPIFEDPNDRGYDAIRRAFLLKMAEVLDPKPADRVLEIQDGCVFARGREAAATEYSSASVALEPAVLA
jgi:hypothetical protein